jgi:hypothetical protein
LHPNASGLIEAFPSVFSKLVVFLEKSKSRTNNISYTLFKDLANGHASETHNKFIHKLFIGQDLETMNLLGSELIQIGHSTGWDILAGILTGMLLVLSQCDSDGTSTC